MFRYKRNPKGASHLVTMRGLAAESPLMCRQEIRYSRYLYNRQAAEQCTGRVQVPRAARAIVHADIRHPD